MLENSRNDAVGIEEDNGFDDAPAHNNVQIINNDEQKICICFSQKQKIL